MPQIVPITLAGTAPASVTYGIMSRTADTSTFVDRAKGIPALFAKLQKRVTQVRDVNQKATGSYRVAAKLTVPVIRQINGVDVVIDNHIVDLDFRIAGTATVSEKTHVLKLAQSMLVNAQFVTSLETGEADY